MLTLWLPPGSTALHLRGAVAATPRRRRHAAAACAASPPDWLALRDRRGAVLSWRLPELSPTESEGIKARTFELIRSIRVFRIPLALWNMLVVLPLMILWFP